MEKRKRYLCFCLRSTGDINLNGSLQERRKEEEEERRSFTTKENDDEDDDENFLSGGKIDLYAFSLIFD